MSGVIAFASNSPTVSTGYGTQAKQFLDHAKRSGFKVAALSNYGLEGANSVYETAAGKIPHYARGTDLYSNDVLPLNAAHWFGQNPNLPGVLVTLYDAWVFEGIGYEKLDHILSWTPVDHMPLPPKVKRWLERPNVMPVAMSKFGYNEMLLAGLTKAEYVPHAIDTKRVFKPTETMSNGVKVSDYLESGSKFVVGMNAANKGVYPMRKAWDANLLAFSIFAQNKDDVMLYLHTEPHGVFGGVNLFDLLDACKVDKSKVIFVDPISYRFGISQEDVAALYTGMDVLLAPSLGEGFGLATIEAQACGTRVIASNFAASAELVAEDGWLVNGQPLWDAPQKAWFNEPFVTEIVNALEEAYALGKGRSQVAQDFAAQYDADKVWSESWLPLLNKTLK